MLTVSPQAVQLRSHTYGIVRMSGNENDEKGVRKQMT